MRRYRLPYWAFVPTLGVWPGAAGATGTGDAVNDTTAPLSKTGTVAVNTNSGRVTVVDARPEAAAAPAPAADRTKWRQSAKPPQQHPNTPSVGGPSWLRKSTVAAATEASAPGTDNGDTAAATARPVTKIFLKPSARAKAGAGGVALSNPISTALVRRGDTVSIEYLPDATAEAGEGGVAISRPELVIHFID